MDKFISEGGVVQEVWLLDHYGVHQEVGNTGEAAWTMEVEGQARS